MNPIPYDVLRNVDQGLPAAGITVNDDENERLVWDLDRVTSYLTQSEFRSSSNASVSMQIQEQNSYSMLSNRTNNDQGILILEEVNEEEMNEYERSFTLPDSLPSHTESIPSSLRFQSKSSPSIPTPTPLQQEVPVQVTVQVRKESNHFRFLQYHGFIVTIFIIIIIIITIVTIRFQWINCQSLSHQQLQLELINLYQKLESMEEKQTQQALMMVVPNQDSSNKSPNDSSPSTILKLDWSYQNCLTLDTWFENWHVNFTPKSSSSATESHTTFLTLETIKSKDNERKEENQYDSIQEEEYPLIQPDDSTVFKSTNPSSTGSDAWPEQFYTCVHDSVIPAGPTNIPGPSTPPASNASTMPTPIAVITDVSTPTWGQPTVQGCCSIDCKTCVTYKDGCDTCNNNNEAIWLSNGPPNVSSAAKNADWMVNKQSCCPGLSCVADALAITLISPTVEITPTLMSELPMATSIPNTPLPTIVQPVPMLVQPSDAPIQPTPKPEAPTPAPTTALPTKLPQKPLTLAPTSEMTMSNGIPLPCCSWNGNYCEQPGNAWCHTDSNQCTGACNGKWITAPKPEAPMPAPTTAPPTTAPQFPSTHGSMSAETTSNGIPLPCCSWNGNYCEQPGNAWCHTDSNQCTGACNGKWITAPTTALPAKAPQFPSTHGSTSEVTTSNRIPLPCCSWNGNYCEQPGNTWCHADSNHCTGACNGKWITSPSTALPTKASKKPLTLGPTSEETRSNGIPLPCCSWNGNYCEQPGNAWCHADSNQCTGACNGKWITGVVSSTAPPTKSSGTGCCTWGEWSTCPSWTQNSQDTCQMTASGCKSCSGTWIAV